VTPIDREAPSRVLLLARVFPPKTGGIERLMHELHARASTELAVRVVAPAFRDSRAFDGGSRTYSVVRCPYLGPRYKAAYLPLALAGLRQVASWRPDLVVCDQVDTGVAGLLIKRLSRRPYVVFGYGFELYDGGLAALKRHIYREASAVIACSQDTAERIAAFAGMSRDAIDVIYPGVDVGPFAGADGTATRSRQGWTGRRIILTVGRLSTRERYKGQDTVIRAMPAILREVPDALYVIAGEGDDRERLERLVSELHLQRHVVFVGRVPEAKLPGLYAAADVFVMVSRASQEGMTEGFGIVYLEAGAARKPVVFARSGGAVEAALDGQTGLAVDPEDSGDVAGAIVRLLRDREEAARLGARGHARASRELSWERAAAEYAHVLRSRLGTPAEAGVGRRAG
jgi:phosphatidylinositol alpha-1,6-mannosyltransferase